jgi:hypothetical protein
MTKVTKDILIRGRTIDDLPEIKPGQMLVCPSTNRMYDERTTPRNNSSGFPEWFRTLDIKERSIKGCQGTQDLLTHGLTWLLPCDVRIRRSPDGKSWEGRYDTPESGDRSLQLQIESFPYESTGPVPMAKNRAVKQGNYVKIVNPWTIKTAPGWSTLLIPASWEEGPGWSLVPGVVHTDFYHHMNWVINIYGDLDEFVIPQGSAIGQSIPFPRTVKTDVLYADEEIHHLLTQRGMGSLFDRFSEHRKRTYRIYQRQMTPESCPFSGNVKTSKFERFRSLLRRRSAGNM